MNTNSRFDDNTPVKSPYLSPNPYSSCVDPDDSISEEQSIVEVSTDKEIYLLPSFEQELNTLISDVFIRF